jgi:DNA mismatch repair protein MutL
MPQRIRVLDDHVVNQIAAGEVVERPAAVAKELIENALDAGAGDITVEAEAGGKHLVRVADNGSGMGRDDALLALERHATSKIRSGDDLAAITTLGFRGEALPSIAAVSRLTLVTRTPDDAAGTVITVEAGRITDVREGARSPGTTFEVRQLFYNVPARRKFLKSTETELRHLSRLFIEYALAYPECAFLFKHDGQEVYRLPKVGQLADRARGIFGKQMIDKCLPVAWQDAGITVTGLAGKPEIARTTSAQMTMYVNRRVIASRLVNHAVMEGYHTLLQKGQYPFAILCLALDPGKVDVNVHPTKREVRFTDDQLVHRAVAQAVRETLSGADLMPRISLPAAPPVGPAAGYSPTRVTQSITSYAQRQANSPDRPPQQELFMHPSALPHLTVRETPQRAEPRTTDEYLGHIWQLHDSFIFAQVKGGVLVIDQHAAHERILYEEIAGQLAAESKTAQQLLFPVTLELSHPEFLLAQEVLPILQDLGFGIRAFGGTTVVVDAIPTSVRNWREGKMLVDILDEMLQHGRAASGLKERLAASYACKAAVKAGDPLKPEEMSHLINRLFTTSNPYTCPHGRPAVIKMTIEELNRLFGRT